MKFSIKKTGAIMIALFLTSCDTGKVSAPPSPCDAFPDDRSVISMEQLVAHMPCFFDRDIIIQGYLTKTNFQPGHYRMYGGLDFEKARYLGHLVFVVLTKEELAKFQLTPINEKILRIQVTAELVGPYILDNVSQITIQEGVNYPEDYPNTDGE